MIPSRTYFEINPDKKEVLIHGTHGMTDSQLAPWLWHASAILKKWDEQEKALFDKGHCVACVLGRGRHYGRKCQVLNAPPYPYGKMP